MSLDQLLGMLSAAGVPARELHPGYRAELQAMTPAQRELVAMIAWAAYQNGRTR